MKTVRILAIIPLALMSLMNIGYPFGSDPKPDPKPDVALAIVVAALGVAGLVAVYGLARNTSWGIQAALTVAGLNVVGAVIALVNDTEGAVVGLVVSGLALLLAVAASSRARRTSVA
jgi:hypothetical protein